MEFQFKFPQTISSTVRTAVITVDIYLVCTLPVIKRKLALQRSYALVALLGSANVLVMLVMAIDWQVAQSARFTAPFGCEQLFRGVH